MSELKELLKERERIDKELEKYSAEMQKRKELNEWKERFVKSPSVPISMFCFQDFVMMSIPPYIHEIIVNALQTEIDKLEEE